MVPLPIFPEMNIDVPVGNFISSQATSETAVLLRGLPFRMYARNTSALTSPEQIHSALGQLLSLAEEELSVYESYNWLLTKDWMALIPRRSASAGPCGIK